MREACAWDAGREHDVASAMYREYSEITHAMRGEEVDLTRALVLVLLALVQVGCATVAAPGSRATRNPSVASGPGDARPRLADLPPAEAPSHEDRAAAEPAPPQPRGEQLRPNDASPAPDIALLRDAVRGSPGDEDARYRLALALLARERSRDEGQGEQRPGPAGPAPQAYLDLGEALIARGNMAEAASWLREALRLQPDLVEARSSLGLALYGMGDLVTAVDELRGLLRTRPDVVRARLILATALVAEQDWAAARAELDAVVKMRPDMLQAHYSLGVVRYTQGDLGGAIEAYRRVLEIDPQHQDARYNLALMLKLARRDAEATPEFLVAAQAGLPRAQYFVGTAYAEGLGVEPDLTLAITWWFRAADQGIPQAGEALAQLREVALGRSRHPPAERRAANQAFRDYRVALWNEFPDVVRDGDEPVGAALLRQGRVGEGVTVLIREASALSEPAQRRLETLYEQGVEGQLPPYDQRILDYFKGAAAEGQSRPRIALARFYARGLGVPKDVTRAVGLLKTTPHEDAQQLLKELSATTP
jgi:TPR repeat protein